MLRLLWLQNLATTAAADILLPLALISLSRRECLSRQLVPAEFHVALGSLHLFTVLLLLISDIFQYILYCQFFLIFRKALNRRVRQLPHLGPVILVSKHFPMMLQNILREALQYPRVLEGF